MKTELAIVLIISIVNLMVIGYFLVGIHLPPESIFRKKKKEVKSKESLKEYLLEKLLNYEFSTGPVVETERVAKWIEDFNLSKRKDS